MWLVYGLSVLIGGIVLTLATFFMLRKNEKGTRRLMTGAVAFIMVIVTGGAMIFGLAQDRNNERKADFQAALSSGYSVYINGDEVKADNINADKLWKYSSVNNDAQKVYITLTE